MSDYPPQPSGEVPTCCGAPAIWLYGRWYCSQSKGPLTKEGERLTSSEVMRAIDDRMSGDVGDLDDLLGSMADEDPCCTYVVALLYAVKVCRHPQGLCQAFPTSDWCTPCAARELLKCSELLIQEEVYLRRFMTVIVDDIQDEDPDLARELLDDFWNLDAAEDLRNDCVERYVDAAEVLLEEPTDG